MVAQLVGDGTPLLDRLAGGAVHDTNKDPRTLGVAQELVPEALALVRTLDEPGQVSDDRGALLVEAPGPRGWA